MPKRTNNPDSELIQKGLRLPKGLLDSVEKLAFLDDSDFSKITRKALRAYLQDQDLLEDDRPY